MMCHLWVKLMYMVGLKAHSILPHKYNKRWQNIYSREQVIKTNTICANYHKTNVNFFEDDGIITISCLNFFPVSNRPAKNWLIQEKRQVASNSRPMKAFTFPPHTEPQRAHRSNLVQFNTNNKLQGKLWFIFIDKQRYLVRSICMHTFCPLSTQAE